jgi:hypothetical protein
MQVSVLPTLRLWIQVLLLNERKKNVAAILQLNGGGMFWNEFSASPAHYVKNLKLGNDVY